LERNEKFFTILFVDKEPNTISIDRLKEYQGYQEETETQREEGKAEGVTQGKTALDGQRVNFLKKVKSAEVSHH